MATLKNTSIGGNQSLDLPAGTTAERPSSPADGYTRLNTDERMVEYFQNGSWYAIDRFVRATSTGGYTSSADDNDTPYVTHVFTEDGSFDVLYGGTVEYMLIGGGGGGGEGSIYDDGGGGGAGGMLLGTTQVASGSYPVIVGGPGTAASGGAGGKGGDTAALGLVAYGGGPGAGHRADAPYYNSGNGVIGSGGGAAGAYAAADGATDGITQGGEGTPGQGFNGGSNNFRNYLGAGGGGAGAEGTSRHGDGNGGAGGRGRMSTITGFPVWYAGGGSGYGYNTVRNAGLGGGGRGSVARGAAYPGGTNTGGGGGGGTSDRGALFRSTIGGSGIVVLRYRDPRKASGRPDIVRINQKSRIGNLDGLVFELDAGDPGSYRYHDDPRIWYDRQNNVNFSLADDGQDMYTASHGGAIKFSQTSAYSATTSWPSSLNVDDNITPRTWEAWARPTITQTNSGIFGHKISSGCSYYCNGGIFIWNGNWAFNWYDNAAYRFLDSGVAATSGEYAHVVCTFDRDANPRIYVNGELAATYGSATNMNYSGGMGIGMIGWNDKDGGNSYFTGEIAILRFYKGLGLRGIGARQNFEAHRGRFGL